ncbi:hypothetical protein EBT31_08445 [bacterium]|nr:hypothetical protein [bacterium]
MTTKERAALWLARVPPAISGSGGHNQTYTAAVGLTHGFCLPFEDAFSLLADWNRSCQPPWTERELAHKVRQAIDQPHDKPRGHLANASDHRPVEPLDITRVTFKKPTKPDPAGSEFRRFIEACFSQGETICICDNVSEEDGRPLTSGSFITREEWLSRHDQPGAGILSPSRNGVFVRINPFKPNLYSGSDNDVSAYRHVLVEMDERPKAEQEKVLRDTGMPITALIDSGGKSIHAWVRVDAPDRKEWEARRDIIYAAIPGIDPKNKNPARFSRLPGAYRDGSAQRLIGTHIGPESWDEWLAQRETAEDQATIVTVKDLISFDPKNDPDNLIGQRWLTRGSSMIISGGTGIGKSSLMMQIVIRWALGKDFFGIAPVRPLRIGIVQAENDRGDLAEAFKGVVQGLNMQVSDICALQENLHFRTEAVRTGDQFLAYARRFINRSKLDLIIGDPLFSYFGGDLSDQGEVSVFLRNKLQPILHETKVAWIWMHHISKATRKDGEPLTTMELAHAGFGSSELANWAREIAVLVEVGQSKPRRFQLAFCKRGSRLTSGVLNLQHSPNGILWESYNPMVMTGAELKEKKAFPARRGPRA